MYYFPRERGIVPIFRLKPIPGVCGTNHQLILLRVVHYFSKERGEECASIAMENYHTCDLLKQVCVWGEGGGLPTLGPLLIRT